MSPSFEEVLVASDPVYATAVLETVRVSHLLCDAHLGVDTGPGLGVGFAFVELWRREFAHIERAVVFTPVPLSWLEEPPDFVDAVVELKDTFEELVSALSAVTAKSR